MLPFKRQIAMTLLHAECHAALQTLFKKMSQSSAQPSRLSMESGPLTFHYMIENNVCFLTLAERAYPKKLAFQYLEELNNEFSRLYGNQIDTVARPYAFIKFGKILCSWLVQPKPASCSSHASSQCPQKCCWCIRRPHDRFDLMQRPQRALGFGEHVHLMAHFPSQGCG